MDFKDPAQNNGKDDWNKLPVHEVTGLVQAINDTDGQELAYSGDHHGMIAPTELETFQGNNETFKEEDPEWLPKAIQKAKRG